MVVLAAALAGCGEDPVEPPAPGAYPAAGAGQTGTSGWPLHDTITITISDPEGHRLAGVPVTFTASDGGSADPAVDTTDRSGNARTVWTLGLSEGDQQLTANAPGRDPVVVHATATDLHLVQVASTDLIGCGVTSEGRGYCWNEANPYAGTGIPDPELISSTDRFTQVAVSYGLGCGLVSADRLLCWSHPYPLKGTPQPFEVPTGGLRFASIELNDYGLCGTTDTGELWCWPSSPDSVRAGPPSPAAPGFHFAQVSSSGVPGLTTRSACGVDQSGTAYCWGNDDYDQLGTGTSGGATSTPQPVAGGLRFRAVEAGDWHSCGVTPESQVYCWGDWPGLGLGTQTLHTADPVQVAGIAVSQLTVGTGATAAMDAKGRLYYWGQAPYVQDLNYLSPIPVPGSMSDGFSFSQISRPNYLCAIATTGAVYCVAPKTAADPSELENWALRGVPVP
jgi:hypothetical protein